MAEQSETDSEFLAFVDVGNGHLAVLWNDQDCVVVDSGGHGAVLAAFLRQYVGHKHISAIVLTHLDMDHSAASKVLIKSANGFTVDRVIFNLPPDRVPGNSFVRGFQLEVEERRRLDAQLQVFDATVEDCPQVQVGATIVSLLGPDRGYARSAPSKNEQSAFLRLTRDGRTVAAICGDIGTAGLGRVDLSTVGKTDALLIPHHGGGPATEDVAVTAQMLVAELNPDIAILGFDSARSDRRPDTRLVPALSSCRVTCLQLSTQCHKGAPPPMATRQVHLGSSTGARSDRSSPCAGTQIFAVRNNGLLPVPDRGEGEHEEFMSLLDGPLCGAG